jgi:hypothetical protein
MLTKPTEVNHKELKAHREDWQDKILCDLRALGG